MNSKKVNFLFILILFLYSVLTATVPTSTNSSDNSINKNVKFRKKLTRVTFVGNSGFIIETGGKKIAIDAFFKGFPGRYTLPAKVIDKMKRSASPFHQIDLILATHLHADHLKTGYVTDYLANNNKTEFISTDEAVRKMERNLPESDLFSNRVQGLDPGLGEIKKVSVKGIDIMALCIPHGSNPVQHNCFMLEYRGQKFIHLGDISGDRVKSIFIQTGIRNMKFDIAFIPYWYLTNQKYADIIKNNINAKYIIAMHLSLTDSSDDISVFIRSIKSNFSGAVIFTTELESKIF